MSSCSWRSQHITALYTLVYSLPGKEEKFNKFLLNEIEHPVFHAMLSVSPPLSDGLRVLFFSHPPFSTLLNSFQLSHYLGIVGLSPHQTTSLLRE